MSDTRTNQPSEKECYAAALRLLSRRDHSRQELSQKLKRRGFAKDQINWAFARCQRYDYLDDDRYAQTYTSQLQRRGYGTRRIRQMLQSKGIAPGLTEKAIKHHCKDGIQLEQCRKILRKKLKSEDIDQPAKAWKPKLYRYLLGRGYVPSIITTALESNFTAGDEQDTFI